MCARNDLWAYTTYAACGLRTCKGSPKTSEGYALLTFSFCPRRQLSVPEQNAGRPLPASVGKPSGCLLFLPAGVSCKCYLCMPSIVLEAKQTRRTTNHSTSPSEASVFCSALSLSSCSFLYLSCALRRSLSLRAISFVAAEVSVTCDQHENLFHTFRQ